MGTQDILQHRHTGTNTVLDLSEFYDFELVSESFKQMELVLDLSEFYDFELVFESFRQVDLVLDFSEFYDFTIGDSSHDYVLVEVIVTETNGTFVLTEDGYILTTHDNYMISYH